MNTALLFTADEEFMKEDKGMEKEKDMEDEEEDMTEGELWDDVMGSIPKFV